MEKIKLSLEDRNRWYDAVKRAEKEGCMTPNLVEFWGLHKYKAKKEEKKIEIQEVLKV